MKIVDITERAKMSNASVKRGQQNAVVLHNRKDIVERSCDPPSLPRSKGEKRTWVSHVTSAISLGISILALFLSYYGGKIENYAELIYSGPDAAVVSELEEMQVQLPDAAVQLFNSGLGSAYDITFSDTNTNVYALVHLADGREPTVLTRIPRLEPGDQATILFYRPSESLNGILPQSRPRDSSFVRTGIISLNINYKDEFSSVLNTTRQRKQSKHLVMNQKTSNASTLGKNFPVLLMPDVIDGEETQKIKLMGQLPNTGNL